jgi:hypothetical protein
MWHTDEPTDDHDDAELVINGICTKFSWKGRNITIDGPLGEITLHFSNFGKASACMRWYGARHDKDMVGLEVSLHCDSHNNVTTFDGK